MILRLCECSQEMVFPLFAPRVLTGISWIGNHHHHQSDCFQVVQDNMSWTLHPQNLMALASFSFECHNFLSFKNSWGPPIPPTTRWYWATNIPCLCITVIQMQKPLVVSNAKTCWVCLHAVWERERLKFDTCLSVPLIREKTIVYNITVVWQSVPL